MRSGSLSRGTRAGRNLIVRRDVDVRITQTSNTRQQVAVMADIGQVLSTGGTTILGVAVGAGLTYWLGALNRRHQEAREDKTRWYQERLRGPRLTTLPGRT